MADAAFTFEGPRHSSVAQAEAASPSRAGPSNAPCARTWGADLRDNVHIQMSSFSLPLGSLQDLGRHFPPSQGWALMLRMY